jgi:DnaK suppressor protein
VNTDLKQVRRILESHLKEATSSRELSESIRIQQVADPADMTQEAAERDVTVQILDRESILFRQLRSAIDRVDDRSYGVCLHCEEEISQKRLNAIPWAELCISCQEQTDGLATHRKGPSVFDTEAA